MDRKTTGLAIYDRLMSAFREACPEARSSAAGLGRWCGIKDYKMLRVMHGKSPLTSHELLTISQRTGLSPTWISTGQGPAWLDGATKLQGQPRSCAAQEVLPLSRLPQTIPLLGFASCGVQGWHGRMTYAVAATAPHARPDMIAVMALGESLLPAGIGNGQILFCDPHAQPVPGEVVYVEHSTDDLCALKQYLGQGSDALPEAAPDEIVLRGWLPPETIPQDGSPAPQKPFLLRIPSRFIRLLAPVIYVQRRL